MVEKLAPLGTAKLREATTTLFFSLAMANDEYNYAHMIGRE